MKQTLVFRTWMVGQGDPVWVCKLTDIVTSLLLSICELCIELMEMWYMYLESLNNINLE